MSIETIQTIILDFQKRSLPELTERDIPLQFIKGMSLSIVGARRSGKTYCTFHCAKQFLERGTPKENICRIQFNDLRLSPFTKTDLIAIDQAYYALYPDKRGKEDILFIFDEIHRIDGWEDYVLYLLEEPNHKVLLTGSTSKLLKGEIASSLRGKNFPLDLYPFSFKEFLRHYKIPVDFISSNGRSHLRKNFSRYLLQGGFPGLLDLDESLHIELLQNYWETMILRDIIEAHEQDKMNIATFSHFSQSLISRIACPMTMRRIMIDLSEAGLRFSGETLYKYLRYLEEAFMVFIVPIYTRSEKVRNRNYHKVYAIDWSLANAVAFGGGIDITRRFENMIYLALKRKKNEIYYYRTDKGYEIDFITFGKTERKQKKTLYQVCYEVGSSDVLQRELRGIPETMRLLEIDEAYVITSDEEKTLTAEGMTVKIVPAWKWLAE